MGMETVRLRLVFEKRHHLLSETQKSQGLKRSWILLRPELETISDLASHISHTFHLQQSCSNGLLLSMDGFVLPSFESTHILKDKDIIRVKRKEGTTPNAIELGDGPNLLKQSHIVKKQPVNGVKLLALEAFEKETGGYQSELEENEYEISWALGEFPSETPSSGKAALKKRKSSKELHRAKRKRVQSTSPEKPPTEPSEGIENCDLAENQGIHHKGVLSKKNQTSRNVAKLKKTSTCGGAVENNVKKKRVRSTSPEKFPEVPTEGVENAKNQDSDNTGPLPQKISYKKGRSSKTDVKFNRASTTDVSNGVGNNVGSMPTEDRCNQLQENNMDGVEAFAATPDPEGTTKRPSRSARRKKAKRQWLRLINTQKIQGLCNQNNSQKKKRTIEESVHNKTLERHEAYQNMLGETANGKSQEHQESHSEAEIVPIVVKPGHICFEPLSEGEDIHQTQDSVGTFHWSGTMSRKKGQKWGMEKTLVSRNNGYEESREDCLETPTIQEDEVGHDSVDFEKLKPLSCLPQKGDLLAYRLVELSSSWCPELSPFRIGKALSYDSTSNKILMVPVPGFPVVPNDMGDEETEQHSETSLYREDGSLEIDFASLVDVRIYNSGNPAVATAVIHSSKKIPLRNKEVREGERSNSSSYEETTIVTDPSKKAPSYKEAGSGVKSNGNLEEAYAPTVGTVLGTDKPRDVWEELSRELTEKKSQLSQKDGWPTKESSGKGQWSYKALRSSALGPTMARLRAASGK